MIMRICPWLLVPLLLTALSCNAEKAMPGTARLDRPEVSARLFHPRRDPIPPDAMVAAKDGVRLAVRTHLVNPSLPTLLLFHGNGEVASDYDDLAPLLAKVGFNLVVGEFRGYGNSQGVPQASHLAGDAEDVLHWLKNTLAAKGYQPRLAVMGRSLGSVCALSLAGDSPDDFDALVLESGFADTLPLLVTLGVDTHRFGLTEADGFHNLEHAGRFTKPTLIIHGGSDTLIPSAQAQRLYAASSAQDKRLLLIPGAGHNTLLAVGAEAYLAALAELARKLR
jgi:alpha-beta hydrolase superfamily lysophospholipase